MADVMGAPEGAVVKTDEEDSIQDELLKQIRLDAENSEDEPKADTDEETPAEEDGGEEAPEAKAEGEDAPEVEAETEGDDDPDEDQEDEGAEPERPAIECPPSWSEQDREAFGTLTPEVQEVISRREGERDEHLQTVTTERDSLSAHRAAFDEITAPYKQDMNLNGVNDLQFTKMLYEAHKILRSDPTQGALWIIEQYNGDAQKIVEGLAAKGKVALDELDPLADDDLETDPHVKRLEGRLKELESSAVQVSQDTQAVQLAAQQADPLQQALNTFTAKTGEDGKPAHPHYEKVKSLMGTFVQNGDALRAVAQAQGIPPERVSDIGAVIEKAYEQALWSSPETRGDLVNGQIAEATEKSRKEVAKKAEGEKARKSKAAKKAAVGVKGAETQTSEAADKPESMKTEILRRITESAEATAA